MESALKDRKLATRAGYGVGLVALGDTDERIVALDGDVSNSTYADRFAKLHPGRFFECKIAEQNMITTGAGLAATGKIPFASSFAKFIARAVDQIDMASITRANLKIVGSHSGVSLGADGPSQMALADVAYFRSMTKTDAGQGTPACHVFHPADAICAYRCCELMANIDGLCYMRTHRPGADFIYPYDESFELRGCKKLQTGEHLTIVSCGYMVHVVLDAARRLAAEGIKCNVFDAYTFPLDPAPIFADARTAGGVILTVEDNYVGGLHSELAEAAAEVGDVRVHGMTPSVIPKSAKTAGEVFTYVGVGADQIREKARALARR
jgi:transketolase